ncbi:hypothetical protein ACFORJ_06895 [Corynebacterium hansenii]|uniref:PPE family domain-containing protein n=1 Tax=Corynebacterium hansenii TaxID=394964 RepID=A0ABV7ZP38_9CORY|nr:hypothetical protein [Corynebacterium hansenii]
MPSMQMVATQHSLAIVGSSGCSVVVSAAIDHEIQWSAANLKSMITALQSHEADTAGAFTGIDPLHTPKKLQVADGIVHHAFGARPPFNPGTLVFSPAVVGPELSESAESLLGKFVATNDAAVGDAITYWTGYATRMIDLATTLGDAALKLAADNEGAAFDAAAASLTGLAARVGNVAASASILVSHLGALPAVKAMAVNTLGSIEAQAQTIPDAAARESFERAEISAFINGPYLGQLQSAVPTLPNLTQPDFSVSAPDLVAAGIAGGHGAAGASQAGLSPAGMTTAASAPGAAASSMAPASSAPITGPNGMNPMGSAPASTPAAPATSGPVPTIPGAAAAPMTPAGATAPTAIGTGAMPPAPTGMSPAASTSGAGAGGAGSRGASGIGNIGGLGAGSFGGRPGGIGSGGSAGPGNPVARGRGGIGGPGVNGTGAGSGRTPSTVAVARTGPAAGSGANGASSSKNGPGHAAVLRHQPRPDANVGAIRGTGHDFEQDEYQRELFGDEPTTVPAVIGANVRG